MRNPAYGEAMPTSVTPETFYDLAATLVDMDDVDVAAKMAFDAAVVAEVAFAEPEFEESEFSRTADQIDREIGDFIMDNEQLRSMNLLGEKEYHQLSAIYNPNNMLFMAHDMAHSIAEAHDPTSPTPATFSLDELDMILRYRVILRRLEDEAAIIVDSLAAREYAEKNNSRPGFKTWAGRVREYGVHDGGVIDTDDYRGFEADVDDDGVRVLRISGTEVVLRSRGVHRVANVSS